MEHTMPMEDTILETSAVFCAITPAVTPMPLSPALRPLTCEGRHATGISAHAEPLLHAIDPLALIDISTCIALRAAAVPLTRPPAPCKLPTFERRSYAKAICIR